MKHIARTLAIAVALYASTGDSQTLTTPVQFTGTGGTASGWQPLGSLTLSGTTLYGMTFAGGTGYGNVFSVGVGGTNYQNLVSFTGGGGTASGLYPYGSLTLSGTTLYGMTSAGGANSYGNLFSAGANGSSFQNLVSFTGTAGTATGQMPHGSLTLSGTTLFGMTYEGGASIDGNIFSAGTDGTNVQNLVSFTGPGGGTASGSNPRGSLTLCGTTLYGMTFAGGAGGYGNIFSAGTDGTSYQNLVSFTGLGGAASGNGPSGSLTLSGTTLYGATSEGGVNGYGNIFSAGTDGTNFQNLLSFTGTGGAASGDAPTGSLTLSGTTLYGTTSLGGADGDGNIFSVGIDGSGYQNLYSFTGGADGGLPQGDLTLSGGTLFGTTSRDGANGYGTVFALALPATPIPEPGTLALLGAAAVALAVYRWRRLRMKHCACTLALGVALCASTADSQTFTTLVQFTGTGGTANGWSPFGSLTLSGTTLYGMTSGGGVANGVGNRGFGNIFSVGTDGANYQNLVGFTGASGTASGYAPHGSLAISGTMLYGITQNGGANLYGNVFSIGTDGTNYQNLVSFTGTGGTETGYFPLGSPTLSGTALYGMTQYGAGAGNIFSVGTGGAGYQNLVSFTNSLSGTATGYDPLGSLILGGSTFYGMMFFTGFGNVFSVGTNGTNYQNLVPYFSGTGGSASGEAPQGSLTLGGGTTLYGMTENGGMFGDGNIFSVGTNGSNFKNLVSFTGNGGTASGADPYGSLILSGTTLYGMTSSGGTGGYGAIFSVGIDGSDFDDLYSFTGGADGGNPHGDLTLSGGTLFGMTSTGGANGDGTVFALVVPEPGTLALAGALCLAGFVWRRGWRRLARSPEGASACPAKRAALGSAVNEMVSPGQRRDCVDR